MANAIDTYIMGINTRATAYKTYWVSPYAKAYIQAYESFKKKLKEQEDWDKMKFELFLTAATIGFGGAMGAVFGKTALATIAGDAALTQICNRNMVRTFNVIAAVSASKPASFIAGEVWDKVSSKVGDLAKSKVESMFTTAPAGEQAIRDPLTMYIDLTDFVDRIALGATFFAEAVRDSKLLSDGEKDAYAKSMMAAPFYAKYPTQLVIPLVPQAADIIELSFYMVAVMDSDYVIESTDWQQGARDGMRTRRMGPVTLPTTSKDYNKVPASKFEYGPGYSRNTMYYVAYDSPGAKIVERINELYQKLFKTDFVEDHWYTSTSIGFSEVAKAEQTLSLLNGMVQTISI